MNKNDLLNNFKGLASELMESIRSDQQPASGKAAPKAAAPKKSAPRKSAAPPKPASPRAMQELIQRGVVLLLVIVCCFSVLFASCAKAEDGPAADSETTVTESAEPALPEVTPAA